MTRSSLLFFVSLAGAFLALLPMPAARAQLDFSTQGDQHVGNLRLPLQRHPNGRVKELFLAKEADMTPDGLFLARGGMALLLLGDDGATNGLARGVSGVYVRSNNTARCDGPVRLDLYTKKVRLEGTNMTWNSAKTLLKIETNAVLTLWRDGSSTVEALQK